MPTSLATLPDSRQFYNFATTRFFNSFYLIRQYWIYCLWGDDYHNEFHYLNLAREIDSVIKHLNAFFKLDLKKELLKVHYGKDAITCDSIDSLGSTELINVFFDLTYRLISGHNEDLYFIKKIVNDKYLENEDFNKIKKYFSQFGNIIFENI